MASGRTDSAKAGENTDPYTTLWNNHKDNPFEPEVVSLIYKKLVHQPEAIAAFHRLKYLQIYLWPNFTGSAKNDHVVSIVTLACCENIDDMWKLMLSDNDEKFEILWTSIVPLTTNKKVDLFTKKTLLEFMTRAITSLHHQPVRKAVGPLVSISCWEPLGQDARERIFDQYPRLRKTYASAIKKITTSSSHKYHRWLFNFCTQWSAEVLASSVKTQKSGYVEAGLKIFIEMTGQLPTRRYTRMVSTEFKILTISKIAVEKNPQLVGLTGQLELLLNFPIDDFTGEALNTTRMWARQINHVQKLQQLVFTNYNENEKMTPLVIANMDKFNHHGTFHELLSGLDDERLTDMANEVIGSIPGKDRQLVEQCLEDSFCSAMHFISFCRALSIAPDEIQLERAAHETKTRYQSHKLQFLTETDYLYRALVVLRQNAWISLWKHLQANLTTKKHPRSKTKGKTDFRQNKRDYRNDFAVEPIKSVELLSVALPRVGEQDPAHVRIKINLETRQVDESWSRTASGETLYLIKETNNGPEIVREAKLLSCDTIRQDNSLIVELDPSRFLKDHKQVASFNYAFKPNKPEHISDKLCHLKMLLLKSLEETTASLAPSWISDVFLGYGDPTTIPPLEGLDHQNLVNQGSSNPSLSESQLECADKALRSGLTLVRSNYGTGAIEVACQIVKTLCMRADERVLVVTNNRKAAEEFQLVLDAPSVYHVAAVSVLDSLNCMRDFIKMRTPLLETVQKLATVLNINGNYGDNCSTAISFVSSRILPLWDESAQNSLLDQVTDTLKETASTCHFGQSDSPMDMSLELLKLLRHLKAFEVLGDDKQRLNFFVGSLSRVVIISEEDVIWKLPLLIAQGLSYSTVLLPQAESVSELTGSLSFFQPQLRDTIKRVVMISSSEVAPSNAASERSLFERFVRLGAPCTDLNEISDTRPEIAALWTWNEDNVRCIDADSETNNKWPRINPGFLETCQFINVEDYQGKGQEGDSRSLLRNVGEAEYAVAIYQYMRLLGYPANKVTILTTTVGQQRLIADIISKRCSSTVAERKVFGYPRSVATVGEHQGWRNDYVIVSLVQTKKLQDGAKQEAIHALVKAMSRARLGLYILGRVEIFNNEDNHGLPAPVSLRLFHDSSNPLGNGLKLVTGEMYDDSTRVQTRGETGSNRVGVPMHDVTHLGQYVHEMTVRRYAYDAGEP